MIQLSNTAKNLFLDSPRAYYLKYIRKLREEKMGSALFFGTAIDAALEAMLLETGDPYEVFDKKMSLVMHNGKWEKLPSSKNVRYFKSDYDKQEYLLEERNLDPSGMTLEEKAWHTLYSKGLQMISQYEKEIKPKIKKVISMQEYIKITNENGDKIIGYIDMICEWEDGRIILFDHKTSSRPYGEKAVIEEGEQLATYYVAIKEKYNIDACGFIVLHKKLRKTERKGPKVKIEVVIDELPTDLIQKTFDEYDDVLYNIKMGNFPCSAPKCDKPWGPCTYKKYCESGGCNLEGLVYVKKDK